MGTERCVRMVALAADDGGAPTRVLLVPWGEVCSERGEFVFDGASAEATIAAFERHGTDLPIDYEHQSLGGAFSAPSGQAPAAGWIKRLSVVSPDSSPAEAPGLWADVEWTEPARQQLASRQYRYLSPVVLVRGEDRRMIGLHSAALTNKPAIRGMRAVVNSVEAWGRLRAALGPAADGDETELVAAAAARIAGLERDLAERAAEERVSAALAGGKLVPAQREWALGLARRDPAGFDEWLRHAPVMLAAGRVVEPTAGDAAEAIARRARREYRAGGRTLAALCSEEAFVRDALRAATDE